MKKFFFAIFICLVALPAFSEKEGYVRGGYKYGNVTLGISTIGTLKEKLGDQVSSSDMAVSYEYSNEAMQKDLTLFFNVRDCQNHINDARLYGFSYKSDTGYLRDEVQAWTFKFKGMGVRSSKIVEKEDYFRAEDMESKLLVMADKNTSEIVVIYRPAM